MLALIALVIFPFVGVAVRSIGRRLYRINKRSQQKVAELNVLLHEAFSGTKIVKAFGREAHEAERFARVNGRLLDLALKDHRTDEVTEPLMEVLAAFGIMGALWYGGHRSSRARMTPGDFFSFIAAMALIYGPVRQLSRIAEHRPAIGRPRSSACSRSSTMPPAIADRPGAHALPGFRQALVLRGRLLPLSRARRSSRCATSRWRSGAGEVVAFVGMSGAGKSTLIDLLPRFHDVTSGRITLDGHDVRDLTQASVRAQIAVVTQETFLFSDSIHYNIAYGNPAAPPEAVTRAARQAHAEEFIAACPEGYDTLVGERGVRLSRRPASAPGHRPRVPQGPAHPDPGRGHFGPRRRERVHGAAGAQRAHARADGAGHRPSPGHGAQRRPHRGRARRPHRGSRTSRRAAGP